MAFEGGFAVRAYSSNAVIPVPDAQVSVTKTDDDGNRRLVAILKTDKSGLTDVFKLPAPDIVNSLSPDGEGQPFETYDVTIYQPVYYTTDVKNVQIFDKNFTTLPVELIPLPEDANPAIKVQRVDITSQNL